MKGLRRPTGAVDRFLSRRPSGFRVLTGEDALYHERSPTAPTGRSCCRRHLETEAFATVPTIMPAMIVRTEAKASGLQMRDSRSPRRRVGERFGYTARPRRSARETLTAAGLRNRSTARSAPQSSVPTMFGCRRA